MCQRHLCCVLPNHLSFILSAIHPIYRSLGVQIPDVSADPPPSFIIWPMDSGGHHRAHRVHRCKRLLSRVLEVDGYKGWPPAANLALINMMPLYLGPHLSFLADLFGISLKSFRIVHRSAGVMSFVLMLLHIFVVIARGIGGFSLRVPENLYGVVVSLPISLTITMLTSNTLQGGSALPLLILLSILTLRKPSYELFLRIHQALAVLLTYATIRHRPRAL